MSDVAPVPERYVPEQHGISPIAYEHWHRYYHAKGFSRDKVVVDVACGEGYGSRLLSGVASSVTGIDIDSGTIGRAKQKYSAPNLTYLVGSATNIPLEAAVADVVVSFETIEHISASDQKMMFDEVRRILKPEGIFLVSTPNLTSRFFAEGQNKFHQKEFSHSEFVEFCSERFKHVRIMGQNLIVGSLIATEDDWRDSRGNLEIVNVRFAATPEQHPATVADAKFTIAVCGDGEPAKTFGSLLLDIDLALFDEFENYAASLRASIVEMETHGKFLVAELERKKAEAASSVDAPGQPGNAV